MEPGTMQASAVGSSTQADAMSAGADPFAAMAAQLTPKRAVSYIRLSTREQAQRGGSE